MPVVHVVAGARAASFVQDDHDRFVLLEAIVDAFGDRLLAYCIMDTHIHVIAECDADRGRWLGSIAMRVTARWWNVRYDGEGRFLRGPVEAFLGNDEKAIARQIHYVHQNPVKLERPIVARAVDYEWSSARRFAGLSWASYPNVHRTRVLLASNTWCLDKLEPPPLADTQPAKEPCATPELLLAAVAQAFGVNPIDMMGRRRGQVLLAARVSFIKLGRLEGYRTVHLAAALRKRRSWINELARYTVDPFGMRVARTLCREPGMRARLHQLEPLPKIVRRPNARPNLSREESEPAVGGASTA